MPNYAQLNADGLVIGVSQLSRRITRADLIEVPEADTALLGQQWDGADFVPGPKPPAQTVLTKLAFMSRFTDAELQAIYTDAKTDVDTEIWLDKLRAAQEIDVRDPRTVEGVAMLEAAGLIAEGRGDDLLAPAA